MNGDEWLFLQKGMSPRAMLCALLKAEMMRAMLQRKQRDIMVIESVRKI
jgi:hypothetical protein